MTTFENSYYNNSFKSYLFLFLNNLNPKLIHILTFLVISSTRKLFFPLTQPSSSITMIPFVAEKLRFCKFVGLSSSACSVLFHVDYLRQESFLHMKGNQGGDQSRPSTWSWHCLYISLHFFSVIFLLGLNLYYFLLLLFFFNSFFFYFLTSDTRQLDYLIPGHILMAHKYLLFFFSYN